MPRNLLELDGLTPDDLPVFLHRRNVNVGPPPEGWDSGLNGCGATLPALNAVCRLPMGHTDFHRMEAL